MANIIMYVGGSRSGKSDFAEKRVHELEKSLSCPVTYVATGTIWDEEFAKRVEKHRQRRPDNWQTIEEPCDLHKVLKNSGDSEEVFLIDCIGTWVTNLIYRHYPQEFFWDEVRDREFEQYLDMLVQACQQFKGTVIFVADEVGMSVVPESKESRIFRDLNGLANQKIAQIASEVYFVVCGIPVQIK